MRWAVEWSAQAHHDLRRLDRQVAARIERVLTNDPGMGVIRHVDAGYSEAIAFAKRQDVKVPMLSDGGSAKVQE